MSVLSNTGGATRPGQRGTTGQLFFAKCGDPPEGCGCKYEEPKGNSVIGYNLLWLHHPRTLLHGQKTVHMSMEVKPHRIINFVDSRVTVIWHPIHTFHTLFLNLNWQKYKEFLNTKLFKVQFYMNF